MIIEASEVNRQDGAELYNISEVGERLYVRGIMARKSGMVWGTLGLLERSS